MKPPFSSTVRPKYVPNYDFTPFGYIDNPYHCQAFNPSPLIRSVSPLGFGFWMRNMPWPYASRMCRAINNYLSLMKLSVQVEKQLVHTSDDFTKNNIHLGSNYHTKNMMSYDWEIDSVKFSAKYYLADEHKLVCIMDLQNLSEQKKQVTIHASHDYGYIEIPWWGSSGVVSNLDKSGVMINKLWEGGDVFILGANRMPNAYKATASAEELDAWIRANDLSSNNGASIDFGKHSSLQAVNSYVIELGAEATDTIVFALVCAANEQYALGHFSDAQLNAKSELQLFLKEDEEFYSDAPLLLGDWPDFWKQGWVQDFETLRATVRRPVGIYQHPWDGMQIFNPRCVLGETHLDMMCLSYADIELAKNVIYGCFADAPMPNVPCSREDGSMNMIGAGGSECGTSPVWGLPFLVIHSIYLRTRDDEWIKRLYPYMKAFIEWWFENRTDAEGWFHCNNSWESGQDGSKRFTFGGCSEADVVDFVRTVDVEACMAHAMQSMVLFAEVSGIKSDKTFWKKKAEQRIKTTREMYYDGWFRDVDARNNQPIILKDYYDVMMLLPVSMGIATEEQTKGIRHMFDYFFDAKNAIEWPSFMFPFTEATSHAGLNFEAAKYLIKTGNRVYARTTLRTIKPIPPNWPSKLPPQYNFRIPGQAPEFWPREIDARFGDGAEHYGWGATMPTLIIRNIFGFKELDTKELSFNINPIIPEGLQKYGKNFGINNLKVKDIKLEMSCALEGSEIITTLKLCANRPFAVTVSTNGKNIKRQKPANEHLIKLNAEQNSTYTITIL